MKIANLRRIIPVEFPPEPRKWLDRLAEILNTHLEEITTALQGRLSAENENADRVEFEVMHNTPTTFGFNVKGDQVDEIRILWSETAYDTFHWETVGEGKAQVTVGFSGAPTTAQSIRLLVRGL